MQPAGVELNQRQKQGEFSSVKEAGCDLSRGQMKEHEDNCLTTVMALCVWRWLSGKLSILLSTGKETVCGIVIIIGPSASFRCGKMDTV